MLQYENDITPEIEKSLAYKIKQIEEMPLSKIYQLSQVQNNDFRIYKEAVGLISEDEKKLE